jgi:hypothetical protein
VRVDLVVLGLHAGAARTAGELVHRGRRARPHGDARAYDEQHEARRQLELVRELRGREHGRRQRGPESFDAQDGGTLGALVGEGLAHGQVLGARLELDPVAGLRRRRQHDREVTVRLELELVEVALSERPGGLTTRGAPVEDVGPEGEADVRRLAAIARQPVGLGGVEDAEVVVEIGIVDDELPVLVLLLEDDGVERVVLLDHPLERDRGHAHRPAIAFRPVGGRAGMDGRRHQRRYLTLGLDPTRMRARQPFHRLHAREQINRLAVAQDLAPRRSPRHISSEVSRGT